MTLSRAEFLRLSGLVASGAAIAACSPSYSALAQFGEQDLPWPKADADFQALSRLTYGPIPEERMRASEIGLAGWIEEQLAFETVEDRSATLRLRSFNSAKLEANELEAWEKEDLIGELKASSLVRQIYSRRQLYETMVEFWSDHFNVSVTKDKCWFLKSVDDRDVVRKHAMGNFSEMLWASAHSPAMLIYLDNQANHKDAPNENYARELMELHSLGVDGGYSQEDVMEVARSLTGWTVKEHFWEGEFTFDADVHDTGRKKVLGKWIEADGIGEGEEVLGRLAEHPSTGFFIAHKMVQRFLCDQPEVDAPDMVAKLTKIFLSTRGDIRAMLRSLLLDGLTTNTGFRKAKFKRPVHFMTSALRMLRAESDGGRKLSNRLTPMGQPTFEWPTPDGPPDRSDAWNNNLMPRWKFAMALASNDIPGTKIDLEEIIRESAATNLAELIDQLSLLLLGSNFPSENKQALLESFAGHSLEGGGEIVSILIAGLIGSPAFQWR